MTTNSILRAALRLATFGCAAYIVGCLTDTLRIAKGQPARDLTRPDCNGSFTGQFQPGFVTITVNINNKN